MQKSNFKGFDDYQKVTRKTAIYPKIGKNFIFPTLGLIGEAGEVANKIKKAVRDDKGKITPMRRDEIKAEIGDMLWYTAQLATETGLKLSDIVKYNLIKITKRAEQDKIHGSGDNR